MQKVKLGVKHGGKAGGKAPNFLNGPKKEDKGKAAFSEQKPGGKATEDGKSLTKRHFS